MTCLQFLSYLFLKQSGQSGGTSFEIRLLISFAGGGDRRLYSATLAGDPSIGSPLQKQFKLACWAAAVNQVGITINQAGCNPASFGVIKFGAV